MDKLDLHGVKHADAEKKVIDFVEKYYNQGKLVKVITGNSEKMKGIVKGVLEEYSIKPIDSLFETEITFNT